MNEPSNLVDDVHETAMVARESTVSALFILAGTPDVWPIEAVVDVAGRTP